nr:MAG: hypothetical protein [Microvirus sp.]
MIRKIIIIEDENGLRFETGAALLDHRMHALQLLTTALFALCNLPPSEEVAGKGVLVYNKPPLTKKKK